MAEVWSPAKNITLHARQRYILSRSDVKEVEADLIIGTKCISNTAHQPKHLDSTYLAAHGRTFDPGARALRYPLTVRLGVSFLPKHLCRCRVTVTLEVRGQEWIVSCGRIHAYGRIVSLVTPAQRHSSLPLGDVGDGSVRLEDLQTFSDSHVL